MAARIRRPSPAGQEHIRMTESIGRTDRWATSRSCAPAGPASRTFFLCFATAVIKVVHHRHLVGFNHGMESTQFR